MLHCAQTARVRIGQFEHLTCVFRVGAWRGKASHGSSSLLKREGASTYHGSVEYAPLSFRRRGLVTTSACTDLDRAAAWMRARAPGFGPRPGNARAGHRISPWIKDMESCPARRVEACCGDLLQGGEC